MADTTASTPAASTTPAAPAATPAVDASKAVPAAKAAPVAEESYDVVIDGKPTKKTKKELIEAYQLRELSDKKRNEADKLVSEYNKVFEIYKKDPVKFMKSTGVDFETLATQFLAKKAEEAMLDPKELTARQQAQELEAYKKYVADQKAAQEKAAKDAEISTTRESIHKEIISAIEEAKDLGMPVDEELVIAVAQKMLLQDAKQKPLNAKEALPKAYESTQKFLKGIAAKMDGESLIKWMGPEVATKIRKYDLQQLKAKRGAQVATPQARVEPKASDKPAAQYKTWSEFKRERLDTIK